MKMVEETRLRAELAFGEVHSLAETESDRFIPFTSRLYIVCTTLASFPSHHPKSQSLPQVLTLVAIYLHFPIAASHGIRASGK